MTAADAQQQLQHALTRLERARDHALALLGGNQLWAADAKEVITAVRAACLLLESGAENAQQAAGFLGGAASRAAQVEAELAGLRSEDASRAAAELHAAFDACKEGLLRALTPFLKPPPEPVPGGPRVVRTGPAAHELRCAECGAVAARLHLDRGRAGEERLVYQGVTAETRLDASEAPLVGALLDAGELKSLHDLVKEGPLGDGLDCFCPECNAAYCFLHWETSEEFDQGAWDCTWGSCPRGHRRVLDG